MLKIKTLNVILNKYVLKIHKKERINQIELSFGKKKIVMEKQIKHKTKLCKINLYKIKDLKLH